MSEQKETKTNTEEQPLLVVDDVHTSFTTDKGIVQAVNGLSFTLEKGKTLGIVGESGSGKSVTSYTIMRILEQNGHMDSGHIYFKGEDITQYSEKKMAAFRGKDIAMIFQDPMTSLNPVYTVGNQIVEAITLHSDVSKKEAKEQAIEMLEMVGINDAERRFKQYPHELSGGMRQRVMIAMALVAKPSILIADEPTTALDVTIQAQILELMQDLQKKLGMAIIIVTHDLGVIAQMADEIVVMYGGRICERGTAEDIFYNPHHEYTKGLLRSIPDAQNMKQKLIPIEGSPINLLNLPKGCAFCARCEQAMDVCLNHVPPELKVGDTHRAACWLNVKNNDYTLDSEEQKEQIEAEFRNKEVQA